MVSMTCLGKKGHVAIAWKSECGWRCPQCDRQKPQSARTCAYDKEFVLNLNSVGSIWGVFSSGVMGCNLHF